MDKKKQMSKQYLQLKPGLHGLLAAMVHSPRAYKAGKTDKIWQQESVATTSATCESHCLYPTAVGPTTRHMMGFILPQLHTANHYQGTIAYTNNPDIFRRPSGPIPVFVFMLLDTMAPKVGWTEGQYGCLWQDEPTLSCHPCQRVRHNCEFLRLKEPLHPALAKNC